MANSISHASLPHPIRKARYSVEMGFVTSAGVLTDPTTPDTEISTNGGASFTDCAEEITTGGGNGAGYLTLSGAEMDNPSAILAFKSANCVTRLRVLRPRNLAILTNGTLSAGSAGGGTLGSALAYDITGCFIRTTGGTGGGGTGGANNQARRIITYTPSTGAFTVSPDWETTPDNTTTFDILLPEGVTIGMLQTINPATPGRKPVVDSAGLMDATAVKVGPSGSATAQTAGDIAGVLGALNVSASSGDPGTTTTLVAYLKQIVNTLEGSVGIPTFPSAADAGNNVSMAEVLRQINTRIIGTLASGTHVAQSGDVYPLVDTEMAATLAAVDTEVAAILAKVINLPSDPADASDIAASFTALGTPLQATDYISPVAASGTISAVISAFELQTNLTQQNGHWHDALMTITKNTSPNYKQTVAIRDYDQANGTIHLTSGDGFSTTPSVGDTFIIWYSHQHAVADIAGETAQSVLSDENTWPSNQVGGKIGMIPTIAGYLDTEVAAILAAVDTEVAAILAKVVNLPSDPADQSQIEAALAALFTTARPYSARATNAEGTIDQLLYEMLGGLLMHKTVGTVKTLFKPDGTDSDKTYNFDADPPTKIEEAT